MNDVGVAQAIRARLLTDTGSGGLWETAGVNKCLTITYTEGPKNSGGSIPSITPYLVYSLVSFTQDDTYDGDCGTYQYQFDIVDDNSSANTYGTTRGAAIGDRLFGDAIGQTNRTPSYGLHRHLLTLTTTGLTLAPWSTGVMYRTSVVPLHEVNVYRWSHTYEVRLFRTHT